jgi:hypothetical protein
MDRKTAISKIAELSGVMSQDATLRIQAIQKEKDALNRQIENCDRLIEGLGGSVTGKIEELVLQEWDIRAKIMALDIEREDLYTQEPIEWRLLYLDEMSGRALVISKKCVAKREFDYNAYDANSSRWQSSSLRVWLNGDFYKSLPAKVRACILEAPIGGGGDRVFLLSIEEAEVYFKNDQDRIATYLGEADYWWLRSSYVDYPEYATTVDSGGGVNDHGYNYVNDCAGVRPALLLKL